MYFAGDTLSIFHISALRCPEWSLIDISVPVPEKGILKPFLSPVIGLLCPYNTSGSQSRPVRPTISIKWNTIHKISIRAGLPGGRREENRGVTAPL